MFPIFQMPKLTFKFREILYSSQMQVYFLNCIMYYLLFELKRIQILPYNSLMYVNKCKKKMLFC